MCGLFLTLKCSCLFTAVAVLACLSSLMFDTSYESLNESNFDKVWNEKKTSIPSFLIVIFNSLSGKKGGRNYKP